MRADEPVAIHLDDIHEDYIDIHRQQLIHTEKHPAFLSLFLKKKKPESLMFPGFPDSQSMMGPTGLEPMTSRTSSGRSSQLS